MLLNYAVLKALWKIDVYLISTLVNNKSFLINISIICTVYFKVNVSKGSK